MTRTRAAAVFPDVGTLLGLFFQTLELSAHGTHRSAGRLESQRIALAWRRLQMRRGTVPQAVRREPDRQARRRRLAHHRRRAMPRAGIRRNLRRKAGARRWFSPHPWAARASAPGECPGTARSRSPGHRAPAPPARSTPRAAGPVPTRTPRSPAFRNPAYSDRETEQRSCGPTSGSTGSPAPAPQRGRK